MSNSRLFVYSYHRASRGAKEIAQVLGAKRIRHERSRYKPSRRKTVINWGASRLPLCVYPSRVLNPRVFSSKVRQMELDEAGVYVPNTTDQNVAKGWLDDGHTVFCRHIVDGHSGRGITVLRPGDPPLWAPLYTKYIPKKEEFRVHLSRLGGIQVDRKARRHACPDPNWQIRNHQNGFVYAEHTVGDTPVSVLYTARKAFQQIGYDFGAVDIIWNEKNDKAYVCEINAAPGIENERTKEFYRYALQNM